MRTLHRGAIAAPRHRLAAATPHVATVQAPAQWLWKPVQLSMWGNDQYGDCVTAEEAAAKAMASQVFIPDEEVLVWAKSKNVLNGTTLTDVMQKMQASGFVLNGQTYDDGPDNSVDWTNATLLQNAIYTGPVKIGIAADQIETVYNNFCPDTPADGWVATGFTQDDNEDHCVNLCGFGSIAWLTQQLGSSVPQGVDATAPAYALFTWGSIGVIDVPSLEAICGEAWLRNPVTVIK